MNQSTRRSFLILAGSGAATACVAGVAPVAAAAGGTTATRVPAGAPRSLVAYVSDVHSGQVSLMVGDHEVVVSDRDLVARLAKAAS
jgi:hypothetical protein